MNEKKEKSSSEIVYHSQAKLEILANLLSHYDSGFGLDKYGVYGLTHILAAILEDLKECVECERHERYLNEYQDQILDSKEKMEALVTCFFSYSPEYLSEMEAHGLAFILREIVRDLKECKYDRELIDCDFNEYRWGKHNSILKAKEVQSCL